MKISKSQFKNISKTEAWSSLIKKWNYFNGSVSGVRQIVAFIRNDSQKPTTGTLFNYSMTGGSSGNGEVLIFNEHKGILTFVLYLPDGSPYRKYQYIITEIDNDKTRIKMTLEIETNNPLHMLIIALNGRMRLRDMQF